MTKRIFRSIVLVSGLVLLIGLGFMLAVFRQYFDGQLQKELKQEASYLSLAVEEGGTDALKNLSSQSERVTLIQEDGTVLFDNKADPSTMENHKDREEIQQAIQNGYGEATRLSSTLGEETVYYAVKLEDGTILRVSTTQYTVISIVLGMLQPVLWIVVLLLILAGIFASRASKAIVEPLNKLDLDNPDLNEPYEEVAPLLGKIGHQQRTIRRQLKDARRQQEEFAMITGHMEEGLLMIDKQTDLLSWNPSALRLLGSKEAKAERSVLSLNRTEPFQKVVETALSGSRAETLLPVNGRFCRISANPVFDEEAVKGAVLLLVDVTESMERENLRREFTANVSHELKTPLTSISGFAEILQGGLVQPKDIQKFAGRIFDEAQRLIVLVSDVIKISQLDEGNVPYESETVDLGEMAKTILDRLSPEAEKNHISLQLEGTAQIQTVKPILEEVLYNLCDNAVKYNRKDGKVTVSIRQGEDSLILSVSDTGIGIPAGDQPRIFERFYRVDKSHSKEIGGTGLGLSIVKHGAAYLGAALSLESFPNEGSTFTLRFPISLEKADNSAPKEQAQ